MTFTTLKTFDNSIEAHLLKSKLESEGLECVIFDEHMVNLAPLNSFAVHGMKLKVKTEDYEKAIGLLEEIESLPIMNEDEVLQCPNCKSQNLITNFKSFKGLKGILSLLLTFLLAVFPIYFKSVYGCKDCGTEFRFKKPKI